MARRILLIDIGSGLTLNAVLPSVSVNGTYSALLSASGGVAPYTYTLDSGILPPGLALDTATGLISGSPTESGSFPFSVRVTDLSGASLVRPFGISVVAEPIPLMITGLFDSATIGTPYSSDLAISGGGGNYINPRVTVGSLAGTGLALSVAGSSLRLSGTPTGSGTTLNVTVAVDSDDGQTATSDQSIEIIDASQPYLTKLISLGPVAAWPLSDDSTVAADVVGGYDATWSGSVTAQQPSILPNGEGLSMGATGNAAYTANTVRFLTKTFTVVGWVKLLATPTSVVDLWSQYASLYGAGRMDTLRRFRLSEIGGDRQLVPPSNSSPVGVGFHFAHISDGSTEKAFINGSQVASGSVALRGSTGNPAPFVIGNGSGGFTGSLQLFAFFDRVLSATEIAELYAAAAP